jgi:ankyrin repeat protein
MMDRPDFDVNGPGYPDSYLVLAAENGHFTVVQALLAAPGIDVNAGADKGISALRAATKNNHRQIAIVLAAMPDIDVNAGTRGKYDFGDYHGYTALMVAAETGNLPLVHMLLAMGTIT